MNSNVKFLVKITALNIRCEVRWQYKEHEESIKTGVSYISPSYFSLCYLNRVVLFWYED